MENAISVINEQEVLDKQFRIYRTFAVDEDEKLIGTIFLSGQNREVIFVPLYTVVNNT